MNSEKEKKNASGIVYSCYYQRSREGEHFVAEHVLSYQISGFLVLSDGTRDYPSEQGSIRFVKRNQLLKFVKQPPANGEFKSLSIYLSQQILKDFSREYHIQAAHKEYDRPISTITTSPLLKSFMDSLLLYHNADSLKNPDLIDLKIKELLILLLQADPELKNVLFDFNEPHKMDLEAFMNKNYHFNVHLERFAYLTGRSLASFKRDFEKAFGQTPGKWLQHKRLQEAYYLISSKGRTASDVYLDLGFEDLSHFSFAFKKQFGISPTKIASI
ncbi:helix-turn-helix domain-containing protein [Pedobacter duraquae]|uniref:AraC-like DNA-binding protein n=1 Tax=Pedobacter duraquae TaxID=425511 RepID=A0A4R6IPN8_9SPHI|nr:AraC family transcriptional regulator [Pedobacter duraquae]TDO24262.1 AraC-like DNA-binding protein [Pedobacter duraquae]